jgi:hypothetical protein
MMLRLGWIPGFLYQVDDLVEPGREEVARCEDAAVRAVSLNLTSRSCVVDLVTMRNVYKASD